MNTRHMRPAPTAWAACLASMHGKGGQRQPGRRGNQVDGHGHTVGLMGPKGWTGLRPTPAMREARARPPGGACIWAPLTPTLCGQKKRAFPYEPEKFRAEDLAFKKSGAGLWNNFVNNLGLVLGIWVLLTLTYYPSQTLSLAVRLTE
jgi:hypothetical protein